MTVIADYIQTQPYTDQESTTHIRAQLICDDQSDLPAPTAIPLYTLEIGSKAHVIADSTDWQMQSDGSWIQQLPPEAAATYTKAEIDQMIDTINNDLNDLSLDIRDVGIDVSDLTIRVSDDENVINDLIDTGAKNLLEMTQTQTSITRTSGSSSVTAVYDKIAGTVTLTGQHYTGDSTLIFEFYSGAAADTKVLPAGSYHMCGSLAGGSTSTYRAALTSISGTTDTGSGVDFTLTEPHYAAYRIFVSGDCSFNGDVFRPMICTQDAWKISQDIVPYTPTLRDLYLLVKSYHP